jgi:hypothetical protein
LETEENGREQNNEKPNHSDNNEKQWLDTA